MVKFATAMEHVTAVSAYAKKDGLEKIVTVQAKLMAVSHLELMSFAQIKDCATVVSILFVQGLISTYLISFEYQGKCECFGTYRGQFCEHIPGGISALCKTYDNCVETTILKKLGKLSEVQNCTKDGTSHTVIFVNERPAESCYLRIRYEDSVCEYYYSYKIDKDTHVILAIQDQTCPPIDYATLGFLSVLIATVVIGVLSLSIWFIVVRIKDKREYAKFEKEQKEKTRFSVQLSPIYKSPITKYEVPEFTFQSQELLGPRTSKESNKSD